MKTVSKNRVVRAAVLTSLSSLMALCAIGPADATVAGCTIICQSSGSLSDSSVDLNAYVEFNTSEEHDICTFTVHNDYAWYISSDYGSFSKYLCSPYPVNNGATPLDQQDYSGSITANDMASGHNVTYQVGVTQDMNLQKAIKPIYLLCSYEVDWYFMCKTHVETTYNFNGNPVTNKYDYSGTSTTYKLYAPTG